MVIGVVAESVCGGVYRRRFVVGTLITLSVLPHRRIIFLKASIDRSLSVAPSGFTILHA
ncbi:hypothetical protein NKDENANG_01322 [Candidatus Entotheonellaceae bacterium PAL068K]